MNIEICHSGKSSYSIIVRPTGSPFYHCAHDLLGRTDQSHSTTRPGVDCTLGYDTSMMTVEYSRGFQRKVGYMVEGYRDDGICPAMFSRHSSSFLLFCRVSLLLSKLRPGMEP